MIRKWNEGEDVQHKRVLGVKSLEYLVFHELGILALYLKLRATTGNKAKSTRLVYFPHAIICIDR